MIIVSPQSDALNSMHVLDQPLRWNLQIRYRVMILLLNLKTSSPLSPFTQRQRNKGSSKNKDAFVIG